MHQGPVEHGRTRRQRSRALSRANQQRALARLNPLCFLAIPPNATRRNPSLFPVTDSITRMPYRAPQQTESVEHTRLHHHEFSPSFVQQGILHAENRATVPRSGVRLLRERNTTTTGVKPSPQICMTCMPCTLEALVTTELRKGARSVDWSVDP